MELDKRRVAHTTPRLEKKYIWPFLLVVLQKHYYTCIRGLL